MPTFYTELRREDFGTLYLNSFALPLVYSAPFPNETVSLDGNDPFTNQNQLLNGITGNNEEYFTLLTYNTTGNENAWTYSFIADSSDPIYLYMQSQDFSYTTVLVNGVEAGNYFSHETNCILYLGSFYPGEQITVDVLPSSAVHVNHAEIARLNIELLKNTLQTLQPNGIQLTNHNGGKLKGTIYVPDGEKIVTSIPYDTGWSIKIDGKKVPFHKYADAFIFVETEPGEHTISFSYLPPGFGTGMIIFLNTLLLSCLYFSRKTPLLHVLSKEAKHLSA